MRRRDFIKVIANLAALVPLSVSAQQAERKRRIGVLMGIANDAEGQARFGAFRESLPKLGWTEGRNLLIDVRWISGDANQIKAATAELVSLAPDVILATNTPTVRALQQATKTIPIVFVGVSDPVGDGFVTSLAKPGSNITGFSNYGPAMAGKWMQLLKEIAPRIAQVTVIYNPDTAPHSVFLPSVEAAATSVAVKVVRAPVRDVSQIESAMATVGRKPGSGIIAIPDSFTLVHRELIATLAARYRVPAVYPFRPYATSGSLISYGTDLLDQYRRAPSYIDRILKGAKPADLPIQAPTKFELVINLKTANALGLDVPLHLQQLANEVIE